MRGWGARTKWEVSDDKKGVQLSSACHMFQTSTPLRDRCTLCVHARARLCVCVQKGKARALMCLNRANGTLNENMRGWRVRE